MFTPPPSPLPPIIKLEQDGSYSDIPTDDPNTQSPYTPEVITALENKRTISRRTRWAVLLVPLALVFITATTRYITHPCALDALSSARPHTEGSTWTTLLDWKPHKRHPAPEPKPYPQLWASGSSSAPASQPSTAAASSGSAPLPATTTASITAVPTIPTTAPTLPTPFPQPFDDSIDANFSTTGCENFFLNMTTASAFRECRPFSLLLQSSDAFIDAQTNLTLLNEIVWGTCNTDLTSDVCTANMAWFASTLQSTCSTEISVNNVMVVNTLQALEAFPLMRTAGCLADQITNSYCYVEAAHSSSPSDLYFYQLPLGLPLPNNTTPSCSSCVKSLMGVYAQALVNTTAGTLTDLQKTYGLAEAAAVKQCGEGYAQATSNVAGSVNAAGSSGVSKGGVLMAVMATALAIWTSS